MKWENVSNISWIGQNIVHFENISQTKDFKIVLHIYQYENKPAGYFKLRIFWLNSIK